MKKIQIALKFSLKNADIYTKYIFVYLLREPLDIVFHTTYSSLHNILYILRMDSYLLSRMKG